VVGENLGPKNQVWDWLAQVIGRSLEIWRHLWRTFRWGFFYRFVFSKIIFWSFFNIFSDILLKEPPEIWWNALGSFVVAGIHQFGMRLAGSRFQSTGGQLSACDADLYAISFGGHECIGRESQMPCDNNFHLICWTNYRSNMKKNHFSCCRRVDIIFEMHPEPISYFLALELHTIFKRHLGISRIFGLQTCTKLICLSMLTFESVEIYLFVLWKFQAVVGIQGVCRYTANFCFSLLVSWNRSLKCGYNYLQLIVTPQKHFQTNDVATTSSRVWQNWGQYLAAIKCHYFGFGELLYFNRTWRTKQETPSETNWMPWSLQSFSLQIVRRTCFQTIFRSTFNRRLNSQQGVWSRLHVECSIGDHLWDDPWVWSPSRHKGSFNIHFQQRKWAIGYTS